MCEFVVVADDKGVEGIFWIQIGTFDSSVALLSAWLTVGETAVLFSQFRCDLLLEPINSISYSVPGNLSDGHFERKHIFFM